MERELRELRELRADNVELTDPAIAGGVSGYHGAATTPSSGTTEASRRSIPLTLKVVRERRRNGGALGARGQCGMRALLEKMRRRHYAYAAMCSAAARWAAGLHKKLTVAILLVSLLASLVTAFLQEDRRWAAATGNAALAVVAGLTAVNNFLAFARREEQFRNSKEAHFRAADLIDIALACEDDASGAVYDYTSVLEEIQEAHDTLKKNAIEIPAWIAKEYPEYEAPWLLRDRADSVSRPSEGVSDEVENAARGGCLDS